MAKISIDSVTLKLMFLQGAKRLEENKEWINDLNVFPVPDGDTGTNMTLTVLSAVKEVQNLSEVSLTTLAKAISSGSLRGARGNSGVIMSQLFRGFTKEIKEHDELGKIAVAAAMIRATETAYKAVMKPKEGTILTVAKCMSEKAEELAKDDTLALEDFADEIIKMGDDTLERTPELLPVLKEAGVVDSGGQGLMVFMKGAVAALKGELDEGIENFVGGAESKSNKSSSEDNYEYCTEFVISCLKKFDANDKANLKAYLETIGASVEISSDSSNVKVHIHTNDPGLAIQKGIKYGTLNDIKVKNRNANAQSTVKEDASNEHKAYGFVTVCPGDGLAKVFREIGVDEVIAGGQTMNPSTDDIVLAVEKVNADTVFVFPNNKNIILASKQAVEIVEDKKVVIIPTKSVPQSVTALICFDPDVSIEDNEQAMNEAISMVKTGQVTYAVRDTVIDGTEIHENDIMGLGDDGLLAVGHDINRVSRDMTSAMVDEDSAVISIYYGSEVSEEEAKNLAADIEEANPDVELQLNYGGQPVYYYIISVE